MINNNNNLKKKQKKKQSRIMPVTTSVNQGGWVLTNYRSDVPKTSK